MTGYRKIKVIFDTNFWISFLIGKKLQFIKDLIASQQLIIVLSDQLIFEIESVTQRPKLEKYFPKQKVEELILFLQTVGKMYYPTAKNHVCRDPKDNFLIDLIDSSKADYMVTGDKDSLVLNSLETLTL